MSHPIGDTWGWDTGFGRRKEFEYRYWRKVLESLKQIVCPPIKRVMVVNDVVYIGEGPGSFQEISAEKIVELLKKDGYLLNEVGGWIEI